MHLMATGALPFLRRGMCTLRLITVKLCCVAGRAKLVSGGADRKRLLAVAGLVTALALTLGHRLMHQGFQ